MKATRRASSLITLLGVAALGLQTVSECGAQSDTPYIPPPNGVAINPQINGETVSVRVDVDLPDTCHYVGNWGQPVRSGNTVYVDAQFWVRQGICLPVIIGVSTQYNLGSLLPGDYNFVFRAWGMPVKTRAFSVLPRLRILRLNNSQARISWPTNATDYHLECAPTLLVSQWTTVADSPEVIGDDFVLVVDLTVGQKFYRLRKP